MFWKWKKEDSNDILEVDISKEKNTELNDDNWWTENLEDLIIEESNDKNNTKKESFFSKLFWKKWKDESAEKSDSTNIFEDFDLDSDLWKEVEEKDSYYVFTKISWVIKYFNLLLIVILIASYYYVTVQNDDEKKDVSYLDPLCFIFLWDDIDKWDSTFCSSISSINKWLNDNLLNLKKDLFSKVVSLLPDAYQNDNFLNSKEIVFLLEKTENRLRPINILSEFDDLLNWYDPSVKERILCWWVDISSDWILSTTCTAFSVAWENPDIEDKTQWIVWFDWDSDWERVSWTSISVASSFLNYLETTTSNFTLLDKQKSFNKKEVTDNIFWFTSSTDFTLRMMYRWNNLLY